MNPMELKFPTGADIMKTLVCLSFLLLGLQGLQAGPSTAVIMTNTGMVEYTLPNSTDFKKVEYKEKLNLPEGSTIRTGSEGVASVSPFPGAILTVAPNTTINLSSIRVSSEGEKITRRQADIKLTEGTLRSVLNRKSANASPIDFKVQTPFGVAAARGTKYIVVTIGGKTYTIVKDGTVTVTGNDGSSVDVTSSTGVAVCGADGKITTIPLDQLPPDVQQAFNTGATIDTPGQHEYLDQSIKAPGNGGNGSGGGGGGSQPKDDTPPPPPPKRQT